MIFEYNNTCECIIWPWSNLFCFSILYCAVWYTLMSISYWLNYTKRDWKFLTETELDKKINDTNQCEVLKVMLHRNSERRLSWNLGKSPWMKLGKIAPPPTHLLTLIWIFKQHWIGQKWVKNQMKHIIVKC